MAVSKTAGWGFEALLACHPEEEEMKEFFKRFTTYLAEVGVEYHKITWPDRHELYDSTVVVISFIFILAVTTLVCDKVIQLFLQIIHAGA